MTGDIHSYLARVLADERRRAGAGRHREGEAGERPARREKTSREAQAFQRARVRASVLKSRRDDGPTAGRPSKGGSLRCTITTGRSPAVLKTSGSRSGPTSSAWFAPRRAATRPPGPGSSRGSGPASVVPRAPLGSCTNAEDADWATWLRLFRHIRGIRGIREPRSLPA